MQHGEPAYGNGMSVRAKVVFEWQPMGSQRWRFLFRSKACHAELVEPRAPALKILLVGGGAVGTVYGADLAAAGHLVSVVAHGSRTTEIARSGLRARDVSDGRVVEASVQVVADPGTDAYDLVLVVVTRDQLSAACASLDITGRRSRDSPAGDRRTARRDAGQVPGSVYLGFPGVGASSHRRYGRVRSYQAAAIGIGGSA